MDLNTLYAQASTDVNKWDQLADRHHLCVSFTAIRPLLAIYFPQILETRRPPVRHLKDHDHNELSG